MGILVRINRLLGSSWIELFRLIRRFKHDLVGKRVWIARSFFRAVKHNASSMTREILESRRFISACNYLLLRQFQTDPLPRRLELIRSRGSPDRAMALAMCTLRGRRNLSSERRQPAEPWPPAIANPARVATLG